MDAKLNAVPNVDIDKGVFKYVLIKVYGKQKEDGSEPSKMIVRGFLRAEWHCVENIVGKNPIAESLKIIFKIP